MKLCNTAVLAGADILIKTKWLEVFQPNKQRVSLYAISFYNVMAHVYKSLRSKALVAMLNNSVWAEGQICHGIGMPGDGRTFVNLNSDCVKMQGLNLCFFADE